MIKLFTHVNFFVLLFVGKASFATPLFCRDLFKSNSQNEIQYLKNNIQSMPEGSKITKAVYENFDVNDIAKSIVSRFRAEEIKSDKNKITQLKDEYSKLSPLNQELLKKYYSSRYQEMDFDKQTEIIMFFNGKNISSIEKDGFLNLYQTGTTNGGMNGFTERKVIEDLITGLQLGISEDALRLRPKSGLVNIAAYHVKPISPTKHGMLATYGPIAAKFKDHVKERTLWSDMDTYSLGLAMLDKKSNIKPENKSEFIGTFNRDFITSNPTNDSYYEALVFGDIQLKDVEYFMVYNDLDNPKYTKKYIRELKKLGKPIYELRTMNDDSNGRLRFIAGRPMDGND